jgi:acetoin utilization deacetylase AcuC-like enzyme
MLMAGYRTRVPPIWLRHDASLAHDIPGHPERPARIVGLEKAAAQAGWFGWDVVEAPAATRAQLELVHPGSHVDSIQQLCAAGGGFIDHDTACVAATWEAALHAAGGAVALVDALMTGAAPSGFAALRPPGHHAEAAQAMGFCFFANVAIAAAHARSAHGAERVLVFDWDVHHGNGTNEIFRFSRDVLFVSAHQWPLYPGTGPASDVGSGDGEGFTVNLPVPPGAGDEAYLSLCAHVVAPLARAFAPDLVLVSAGFDAHELDPLASCRVTEAGFAGMTGELRRVCAELGVPLGLVLEGGYSVEALAASVCALAPVLGATDPPPAAEVARHPLADAAWERLRRYWPTA